MSERMRILSGMRPTGRFHLGNYLGAAKNWVGLQKEYDCYYFIADYHALTTVKDRQALIDLTYEVAAAWLAMGSAGRLMRYCCPAGRGEADRARPTRPMHR